MLARGVIGEQIGLDVVQDRIFVQVVLDDVLYVGVHGLVVGEAGAKGVGDRNIAGAIGIEETRTAKTGVLAED